jgi:probable rRNA maturation factor
MPAVPGEPRALGDVALAYETVLREAQDAKIAMVDHFQHLIVHASLHLIGYTHEADEEAERMEALEIAALGGLGVSNPYEGGRGEQTSYGTREP